MRYAPEMRGAIKSLAARIRILSSLHPLKNLQQKCQQQQQEGSVQHQQVVWVGMENKTTEHSA